MGAAAAFEMQKPVDASEIRATGDLNVARSEVIRLRKALGHLARDAGFAEVIYDASDICLGTDEREDFERCVCEVAHIRRCLQLRPQSSTRRARAPYVQQKFVQDDEESDDSSDDDEK